MIQIGHLQHQMDGLEFGVDEVRHLQTCFSSEQKLLPTSMPTKSALIIDSAGVLFLAIGRQVNFGVMSKVEASLRQSLSRLARLRQHKSGVRSSTVYALCKTSRQALKRRTQPLNGTEIQHDTDVA